MEKDASVHITVPADTKARWVRASRSAGLKLTDYITQAVEHYMTQQIARLAIPTDIDFADLKLSRDADGHVSFDWQIIMRICDHSHVPVELLSDAPEDGVAGLLVSWYMMHRQHGGTQDPVAEDLMAEAMAEDAAGQPYSHAPGRA